jgi:hypothetical protein
MVVLPGRLQPDAGYESCCGAPETGPTSVVKHGLTGRGPGRGPPGRDTARHLAAAGGTGDIFLCWAAGRTPVGVDNRDAIRGFLISRRARITPASLRTMLVASLACVVFRAPLLMPSGATHRQPTGGGDNARCFSGGRLLPGAWQSEWSWKRRQSASSPA